MATCSLHNEDNKNNGLITKIWGSAGWTFNHSVTFGYPIEPVDQNKEDYKEYFTALGNVLPCKYCRESYKHFISSGDTKISDEVFASRDNLTRWFYDVHNQVNKKLDVDYGITYEDVVKRYESFRAKCGPATEGCVAPLDYKAFSFKKLNQLDCPVITLDVAAGFMEMAIQREIHPDYFVFIKFAKEYDGDVEKMKQRRTWSARNMFCQQQIKYMREAAIPSIETEGRWKGYPTIEELKLILFMCSNLCRTDVKKCLDEFMASSNNPQKI